jgi:hypothetical protein
MIKTKLWAQKRALASNNIDKSCVASTSSLGGPETDVYTRSLVDLVNMYQSHHIEL